MEITEPKVTLSSLGMSQIKDLQCTNFMTLMLDKERRPQCNKKNLRKFRNYTQTYKFPLLYYFLLTLSVAGIERKRADKWPCWLRKKHIDA